MRAAEAAEKRRMALRAACWQAVEFLRFLDGVAGRPFPPDGFATSVYRVAE
jgi:hypothetical protein